jgi:hypothetical protein
MKVLEFGKKPPETEPPKNKYTIIWEDFSEEVIECDIMDPTYHPLVIFANYASDTEVEMVHALNFNKIVRINIK